MAKKKRIILDGDEPPPEKAGYKDDKPGDWRSWLRLTYAKYWFALVCLFVDVIVALEIARVLRPSGLEILALPAATLLGILEYLLFRRLWPHGRDGSG